MATVRARRVHKPGLPAKVEQPASVPAKDIFLLRYESTLSERDARMTAGLSIRDVEQARADDPDFDARCVDIERQGLRKLEERAFEMARDDPTTLRWLLERLCPEKFGTKQRLDINVRDVSKLSDEDLESYILQCQGKTKR